MSVNALCRCHNHKHPHRFLPSPHCPADSLIPPWFQKQCTVVSVDEGLFGRLGNSSYWWLCLKVLSFVSFFPFKTNSFPEKKKKVSDSLLLWKVTFSMYATEVEWLSQRKSRPSINNQKEISCHIHVEYRIDKSVPYNLSLAQICTLI